VRLPRGLITKFPNNLAIELKTLPEIVANWKPVEDEPFTDTELSWVSDYIFGGILKLVYMYSQFIWAFYDNSGDDKMALAYDSITNIYD
jgi:hypothetical protein